MLLETCSTPAPFARVPSGPPASLWCHHHKMEALSLQAREFGGEVGVTVSTLRK